MSNTPSSPSSPTSPTLSVIVPTLNRPTLLRAIVSCSKLTANDQIIVIADGPRAVGAKSLCKELTNNLKLTIRCVVLEREYNDWGATPRTIGLSYCTGDWIIYMDDDDYYLPEGISTIRKTLTNARKILHLFRANLTRINRIVWTDKVLKPENVSTLCIAHPNDKRWQPWRPGDICDFHFAGALVNSYGGAIWIDEVVARSDTNGKSQP